MPTLSVADVIRKLDLKPHPEGGHFRETFRDARVDGRAASTAIYFLLSRADRSHWHRIDAAEVWHYCAGAPLVLEMAASPEARSAHEARSGPRNGRAAAGRSCPQATGRRRRRPATGR
jgi:predicted cupin superfamily sugar epimerase